MDLTTLMQFAIEQTQDYALFLLDVNGNIVSWNRGAARIKGYAEHEIIGRHFSTFYTREALETGWPDYELKVAAAEGRFEDEGWRIRKDGSRFWANVVITALRDTNGKLVGFSKITRDLTERKKHEELLAQSEERFRLLVEGVLDYAIFMLDPQGLVSSWNSGAERIIGYRANEIIGKHFSRFFPEADREASKPWEELAIARDTGRFEGEGWRVRSNGDQFWARAVITGLYDQDRRLRGFAKVTQDLTQQRHVQALEAAAKNVNEFIAVLAHELRNPLAPIQTAVQVIESTPPGHPERERMHAIINRQAAQLSRIVDDMLEISRVTRGELVLQRAPLDLSDVAREVTESIASSVAPGRHHLEMDLAKERLNVVGDAHRLAQLITNLLNNAIKYTPSGGRITVTTGNEDGWAVLRVRDTGRGIDPQWTERIFDMFVQGRPAIERVGGGLGIGLALSRKIAELHSGSLTAASEGQDKGSEFSFRMPLAASEQRSIPKFSPGANTDRPISGGRRVLIVDDNVDAAATLEILLRSLQYETCVAHTGPEALDRLPEFRPDVVLLDIGLPGMDGYEVARRMAAVRKNHSFRIVAVTGWGQETDRHKSAEAGVDLHLVKPIDATDLAKALEPRNNATLH
jgi:PAS domain S-box-containing protein